MCLSNNLNNPQSPVTHVSCEAEAEAEAEMLVVEGVDVPH